MDNQIERAKDHFLKAIEEGTPRYAFFPKHVGHVEQWAKRIFEIYPSADEEIVFLSVWLHDIGQADGDYSVDHAIKSEYEVRRFLSNTDFSPDRIDAVAHCVRAHRCRDIQPKTLEAKILAAADSASHMTGIDYLVMLQNGTSKASIQEKLERDYRDVGLIPEIRNELALLYNAWEKLLDAFPSMTEETEPEHME